MTKDTGNVSMQHPAEVGKRIRSLREEKCIDEDGLGATIGCSQTLVSFYETGTRTVPSWRLRKIADFFNCPVSYLVAGEPWSLTSSRISERPGSRAIQVQKDFDRRLDVALDVVGTWDTHMLPMSHLPLVLEPCRMTLLDIDYLDTGLDMLHGIKILDRIIGWAEQALTCGVAGASTLLFDACDKAVHFRCYIRSADVLLGEAEWYLAKMARVIPLAMQRRSERLLTARLYARWGDTLKICAAEEPGLRRLSLDHFRVAWDAAGREHIGYHADRSPGIVAASLAMSDSDFAPYLTRVDRGLDAGRMLCREEIHAMEGRSEMLSLRGRVRGDKQASARALDEWAQVKWRLSKLPNQHTEMRLRAERLSLTLWDQGIREHIEAPSDRKEEVVARMTRELYTEAKSSGSDRMARGLKKKMDAFKA